jgi:hypothetical protein
VELTAEIKTSKAYLLDTRIHKIRLERIRDSKAKLFQSIAPRIARVGIPFTSAMSTNRADIISITAVHRNASCIVILESNGIMLAL